MEGEKKNIQFTAEDIRKYLDGELSGPEMQAMEKAALDDPFLADALEGYEESRKQSYSFESDLADLRNRLTERTKQQKRKRGILIPMKWTVAASILIIASATVFTFIYVTQKTNQTKIAKTEEKDSSVFNNRTLPGAVADTTSSAQGNPVSHDSSMRPLASEHSTAKVQIPNSRNGKSAIQRDLVSSEDLKKTETSPDNMYHKDYDSASNPGSHDKYNYKDSFPSPLAMTPEQDLSGKVSGVETKNFKSSKQIPSKNYVSGIVVDERDQPVTSARVSLIHSNMDAVTDSNGYFKLYLKNSDSVGRIAINYVGYQAVSKDLKTNSSINERIRLRPTSVALNEVVVSGLGLENESGNDNSGYGASAKRREPASSLRDSIFNKHAAPSVGWTAFYQYLEANKKIGSADSVIRGTEMVTFQVNSKGELSSFKIIKSVSPAHDALIIHLIKTGPGWKISKGKKQTCRIRVSFP